jgi:alpha-L-glutamate ligase-like protein
MFDISKGILGLNARNLLYVNKYNQKSAIKFANNKLKTKHFLSARGIPVPKLYRVVKNHEDINRLDFGSLPGSVVLKPNLGSQGKGILVFKSRKGSTFTHVNGQEYSQEEIKQHIIDIIDGRYSMGNIRDTAFFEQLIVNHKDLAQYTWAGLPDVRVIMHNLVPVMAMLRLPTQESGGRANLSQGALGIGVDIATGRPTHISYKNKIIDEIPGFGPFASNFKIPHWDEILNICAKSQYITNLGFLGCDIAIDNNNGPILIEINARPGTKIQIANKAPLEKRLKKISNITIKSPEKGVRVGKDLFGRKDTITNARQDNKIISTEENVEIIINSKKINLKAKVDLNEERTIIDEKYKPAETTKKHTVKITFSNNNKIITAPIYKKIEGEHSCILGFKDLQGFLIKPKVKTKAKIKNTKKVAENIQDKKQEFFYKPQIDFGQVDHQIFQVMKQIKILSLLRPTNLDQEISKFEADTTYNPQFEYKNITETTIPLLDTLANIKVDNSELGLIFKAKIQELNTTIDLVNHIGTDYFSQISEKLYPHPTQAEVQIAKILYTNKQKLKQGHKVYKDKKVAKLFNDFLKKSNLNNWKVQIKENMIGNCSVNKSNTIFIKKGSRFHETRVKKLIAHEIETHIFTAENGKRQPYKIFQYGTANFLETQEGLAIYNQEKTLGYDENHYFAAINLLTCDLVLKHGFAESYKLLVEKGIKPKKAIKFILKTKRGMGDTSKPGGFAKQAIYTRGALKIDDFVKKGGKLSELYIGKISLDILDDCKKISSLNPPIFIPKWY